MKKNFQIFASRTGFPKKNCVQHLFSKRGGASTTLDGETVLLDKKGDQTRTVQQGRAYLFDGSNDLVEVSSFTDQTYSSGSISCWFKAAVSQSTSNPRLVFIGDGASNNRALLYFNSNFVRLYLGTGGAAVANIVTNSTLNDDTWHHVVGRWETDSAQIWVDGVKQTDEDTSLTMALRDSGDPLLIGSDDGANQFTGKIKDVHVFNKYLTDVEIASLYNNEAGVATSNLTALYKCDEGAGTVSYDSSGNENHGTITNATLSTFHSTQNEYSWQNEVGYNNDFLWFNGSNSYLSIPDSSDWLSGGQDFTITAEAYFDDSQSSDQIVGQYANSSSIWTLEFSHLNDRIRVLAKKDGSNYANFSADNLGLELHKKYKIQLKISGTTWKLYLNDNEVASTTSTQNSLPDLSNNLEIGRRGYPSHYHPGGIYNVTFTKGSTTVLDVRRNGDLIVDTTGRHTITNHNVALPYIPRDESDTTKDVLGNPLTYTGRVKYNASLVNSNAATFDGVDDYINVSGLPNDLLSSDFSISFYHNKTDKEPTADNDRFFDYKIDANNQLQIITDNDSQKYAVRLTIGGVEKVDELTFGGFDFNTNTHVAVTYDSSSSTFTFYKNGIAVSSDGTEGVGIGAVNGKSIGRRNDGNASTFYKGSLNGFTIYSKVLSASDVQTLSNNSAVNDSIIAYYPLAEGAGAITYDASGNDNHGTITNATLATFWGTKQDKSHYNLLEGHSKAMHFDGVNDYISVTSNDFDVRDLSAKPFEISFKVNLTEDLLSGSLTSLVTIGTTDYNSLHIGVEATNKVRIIYSINGSSWVIHLASTPLQSGWNNIVITRDASGNYLLTSNGVTYINATDTNDFLLNNYQLKLGAHYSLGAAYYLHGELVDFDFKVNGTSVATYSGLETSTWTDTSGQSNDGTVNGSPTLIRIPALSDGTADAAGGTLLNPAGNFYNDAETEINQPLAPVLIQADIACNKDFWFNSDQTAANDVGYSDIVADVATGDEQHVIFADVTTTNEKKNIVTYLIAQAGSALAKIQKYLGIEPEIPH
jgi:hypothetical protein